MNLRDDLEHLQWIQLQHDKAYHSDIWCLTVQTRIKHMVLHLAKYSSQLTVASIKNDALTCQKNLLDTVIICTSISNILNVSIYEKLAAQFTLVSTRVSELPAELSTFLNRSDNDLEAICEFSSKVALLCKAIESTDHFEAYQSRDVIVNAVESLWVLSLQELNHIDPDKSLTAEISNRLYTVEKKNIHFSKMGNYKDGF